MLVHRRSAKKEEAIKHSTTPPVITVAVIQPHELPAIVARLVAQQRSLHTLDPRLPLARTSEELTSRLSAITTRETTLMAHGQHGRLRGAAIPGVWKLSVESTLRA